MQKLPINSLYWPGDIESFWPGHQFSEIFKERIYAPYLEDRADNVVIDVGGNLGVFSLYAAKYSKQVYCLEPDPELTECIQKTMDANGLSKVKVLTKALYIENKPFPFYRNPNRTMNSLHQAVAHKDYPPIEVPAITLDKLFEDEKIDHVDVLKMDCEGSEFEIICSDSFNKVADKITTVIGETHGWAQRNPQQLINALTDNGFEYRTIPGDATLFVGTKLKTRLGTKY